MLGVVSWKSSDFFLGFLLKVSAGRADHMSMEATTAPTETITLTIARGELFIEDEHGNRGFGVVVDGPIRGRELIWAERADGTSRVIPATAWRDFIG
jgi:hypothetical protein